MTMITLDKLPALAEQIAKLPGILSANPWTAVPGKARIYLETTKHNGGRAWNGGVGFQQCYIEVPSGRLVVRGEAGAATRKWHAEHTWPAIKAILAGE